MIMNMERRQGMAESKFSMGEAVRFGWEVMKNNLLFFVAVLIITWIVQGIFSVPSSIGWPGHFVFYPFFSIISMIIGVFVGMAYIKIALGFCDGKEADFSDLWTGYPLFFKYLIGSILYGLIVLGGLILLIVPGIIWAIKYSMFGYLIIDREMPPVEALKKSGQITKGSKGNLFLLGLLFLGIVILGALACVVGLFAAIPTVFVAHAFVYRKLVTSALMEEPAMLNQG
jgi:uncharacterized membrane protein